MKLTSICLLFLLSCSSSKNTAPTLDNRTVTNLTWEILEEHDSNKWNQSSLFATFGKPRDVYTDKKDGKVTWIFDNQKSGFQEWAFNFDINGRMNSATYIPSDGNTKDFTLDQIKKRWEKFNCENKEKQILQPGLIKIVKYVSCDNGKRYIEYNKYNEVLSVSIQK